MNRDLKYWAVVPAAGAGRRMQSHIPKQYLSIDSQTIIEHSIERLLSHPAISGVCVALSADDGYWEQTKFSRHPDVTVVTGGAERCHSVLNALDLLLQSAHPLDRVLVHDAARPCLCHTDISLLIEQVGSSNAGGLLGSRVKDTMKRTQSNGCISATVERENLWHAFTPQLFPLGVLRDALVNALQKKYLVTDEASAMELAGFQPLMVEGHADNIKVTNPQDLALAQFFLDQQKA